VGPQDRIQQAAQEAGLDIAALPIVHTEHSHDSAFRAVELIREGKASVLMKGSCTRTN
jgi:phosphate acetyltransferase